jgi:adenylate kinase
MEIQNTLIIMGRSGSGKGTQVALLKEYLEKNADVYHFESGHLFREMIKGEGYTNEAIRDILGKGDLVPDFFTDWLLVNALIHNITNKNQIILLDGYPRTLHQVETLEHALSFYGRNQNIVVLHINVSEQEVRRRIAERGRGDDISQQAIENRIQWYNENVLPTIELLRTKPHYTVIDIHGEGDIMNIQTDIRNKLNI